MKKLMVSMIAILGIATAYAGVSPTTVTGTYVGQTEDGYFKFKLDDGSMLVCEDMDFDIEIDLYDDESTGKRYKLTWITKEVEDYDDEGEPTGSTSKIKYITALEEV